VKSTLEFNLPDDEQDMSLALNGRAWYCAMNDLDEYLRGIAKYGTNEVKASDVRAELYKILEDRNLRMGD
jgi:hypothetical protein